MAAPPEMGNPAAQGGRALCEDRAGKLINVENSPNPFTLQVSRLRRKFGLADPVARTIAEMAFGVNRGAA